ncbi:MAG: Cna B-type domain-containing protein, partial [Oscillospiraceae bacterium]
MMKRKKMSARILTVFTAVAMLISFVLQTTVSFADDTVEGLTVTASDLKINGQPIYSGMQINDGDAVSFSFDWVLPTDYTFTGNPQFIVDFTDKMQNIVLTQGEPIYVLGANGEPTACYTVLPGNQVKVELLQGVRNRRGSMSLDGVLSFDGTNIPENGETQFEFFGESTTVIIPSQIARASVSKSAGALRYDETDGKYYKQFNVVVSAGQRDVTGVTFTDTVPDAFVFGGIDDLHNANFTPDVSGNVLTYDIGTMQANETKTFSYELEVKDNIFGSASYTDDQKTNSVTVNYKQDGETITGNTATARIDVNKPSVNKYGMFDENTNKITWTITVNPGDVNANDFSFTAEDTLGENLSYSGALDLSNLTLADFTENNGSYTLSYETSIVDESVLNNPTGASFKNNVSITTNDGYVTGTEGTAHSGSQSFVSKDAVGLDENGAIQWKISVYIPDESNITNFTVSDSAGYMSTPDIDSVVINGAALTNGTVESDDYSGKVIAFNTSEFGTVRIKTNAYNPRTFSIVFPDEYFENAANLGRYIDISVKTTVDSGSMSDYFSNSADLSFDYDSGSYSDSDDANFRITNKISKSEGSIAADSDFEKSWSVYGDFNFASGLTAGQKLVFLDTLPEGMILAKTAGGENKVSLKIGYTETDWGNGERYADNLEVIESDGEARFVLTVSDTIADLFNTATGEIHFELQYNTVVENINGFVTSGETSKDYLNQISFYLDNQFVSKADKTQTVTYDPTKTLNKTGVFHDQQGLTQAYTEYTVQVNRNALDLSESGVLELTDTLGSRLVLQEDSITVDGLTRTDDRALVDDTHYYVSFDGNHVLTIVVPDEKALTITYKANVIKKHFSENENPDDAAHMYTNSVKLIGGATTYGSTSHAISAADYSSAADYEFDESRASITISGTKSWDNGQFDLKTPEQIKISLTQTKYYPDGSVFGTDVIVENVTLTSVSVGTNTVDWSYTIEDLVTEDYDGYTYSYDVTEVKVNGYTASYQVSGGAFSDNGPTGVDRDITLNIMNTVELIDVTGTKTWVDNDDPDRPTSLELALYKRTVENGQNVDTLIATTTATEAGGWDYTFSDVPEYENGEKINYIVKEYGDTAVLRRYDSESSEYDPENHTAYIRNTLRTDATTSVEGLKTWEDGEYADITRPDGTNLFVLKYADGSPVDPALYTFTYEAVEGTTDQFTYKFDGLPAKNDNGEDIRYYVEENPVDNYTSSKSGNDFTNTLDNDVVSVSGTKSWDKPVNIPYPASIEVTLKADGEIVDSITVTADNNWTYDFGEYPKYKYVDEQGTVVKKEIVYTVEETPVDHFTASQGTSAYDILNTYVAETVDVSGEKTWADDNNAGNYRPDSVKIELLANGTVVNSKIIAADEYGDWRFSFGNLPKTDNNGNDITYTVREADTDRFYTASVSETGENEFEITNTLKSVISVSKVDAATGGELPGATLQVKDAQGNLIEEWVSTETPHLVVGLEDGTYTLTEITAPKGYTVAETIVFIVENGKVTGDKVEMRDAHTEVSISKTDDEGAALSGAEFTVYDTADYSVDSWTSDGSVHTITGLETGKIYIIKETSAPEGYEKADDISFMIDDHGNVSIVTFETAENGDIT